MNALQKQVRDEGNCVRVTGGGKAACDCVRNPLTASGINLANVWRRRPKHLDREVMILWLQQRQSAGKSLKWTAVCLESRDYALAIRQTFGSWRKALDAAGVSAAK